MCHSARWHSGIYNGDQPLSVCGPRILWRSHDVTASQGAAVGTNMLPALAEEASPAAQAGASAIASAAPAANVGRRFGACARHLK
ncbi:MAG: hypothetical protein ACR2KU_06405 [Gammaproteobacteria bacterium]